MTSTAAGPIQVPTPNEADQADEQSPQNTPNHSRPGPADRTKEAHPKPGGGPKGPDCEPFDGC